MWCFTSRQQHRKLWPSLWGCNEALEFRKLFQRQRCSWFIWWSFFSIRVNVDFWPLLATFSSDERCTATWKGNRLESAANTLSQRGFKGSWFAFLEVAAVQSYSINWSQVLIKGFVQWTPTHREQIPTWIYLFERFLLWSTSNTLKKRLLCLNFYISGCVCNPAYRWTLSRALVLHELCWNVLHETGL